MILTPFLNNHCVFQPFPQTLETFQEKHKHVLGKLDGQPSVHIFTESKYILSGPYS